MTNCLTTQLSSHDNIATCQPLPLQAYSICRSTHSEQSTTMVAGKTCMGSLQTAGRSVRLMEAGMRTRKSTEVKACSPWLSYLQ